MNCEQLATLLSYEKNRWAHAVSDRWIALCTSLRAYEAPERSLTIPKERKWELVSAFQKAIRRGDKEMALRLVSGVESIPNEYLYFWRRLCVVVCEDVGPADDVLAAFTIACSTICTPKKNGSGNYDLFCFFAEQMCDLSNRSRIYCSYAVIEPAATESDLPELLIDDRTILAAVIEWKAALRQPDSLWRKWQRKNDWRAAGLLKYIGLTLPFEMTRLEMPVPDYAMLFDLPSYCFDMYTRVGLVMLKRIVKGVQGAEAIKELFQQNRVKSSHKVLGEALFFVEGGRIQGELIYEPLCSLEQRLFAYQFGLPLNTWLHLQALVAEALEDGVIDRVRQEVLRQSYE